MPKQVEFGVRLPTCGPLSTPQAIDAVAKLSDRLEYDAVWVNDYIAWMRIQNNSHFSCGSVEAVREELAPMFHESLTTLAYVAGITSKVKLAIAVLCLPFRNPVVTARQVANIDLLSGGRFILGVGPGGHRSDNNRCFEVLGVPRSDKYRRTVDYLKAMIAVWTMPMSSYQGEFISFPEGEFYPKPVQKPYPPIWGGGWADKSMDIVAEYCTGWIPGWIWPEEYPAKVDDLYQRARAKGRGDVEFDIGNEIFVAIDHTHEAAYEKSKKTFAILPEGFMMHPPEEKIRGASLIGSPEEVCEQVRRYVEGGVTHFELKFISHDLQHVLDQVQIFAEEVAPAFSPSAQGA